MQRTIIALLILGSGILAANAAPSSTRHNPEIPGSGYTCHNVQALGMMMRECDWSSN